MLLTLSNLPNNVSYSDIKALVYSKCNIQDIILDNLTSFDNFTKQITIGLTGEEDAAVVMRNLNGFYLDGKQLQVIPKSRTSGVNVDQQQSFIPSLIAPSTSAGYYQCQPNWYMGSQGTSQPMASQNTPMSLFAANLLGYGVNASQTAYYQMNQPAYSTQSSLTSEKIGYPPPNAYGNRHNQSNIQNNWSQQQSVGSSNVPESKNKEKKRDSKQQQKQQRSQPDRKESRSRDPRSGESYRRSGRGSDNNVERHSNQQSNDDSRRNLKRAADSELDCDWRYNDQNANHNSFYSNQSARSSGQHYTSSPYAMGNYQQNQSNAGSTISVYGSHVTHSSNSSNKQDARFNQHAGIQHNRYPPSEQQQVPSQKRSRLSNSQQRDFSNNKTSSNKQTTSKSQDSRSGDSKFKATYNASETNRVDSDSLRVELACEYANMTLQDTCCKFDGVDRSQLLAQLKRAFKTRIDKNFKNASLYNKKHLIRLYKKNFDLSSHCYLLKEAVRTLGGRMITMSKFQPGNLVTPVTVHKRKGPVTRQEAQRTGMRVNKPQAVPLAQIPGRIPQYTQGDKKIYKQEKKEDANMFNDHAYLVNVMKNLKPATRLGMGEEMEIIHKLIMDACESTSPEEGSFCEKVKLVVPQKLKNILKVNLVRRMLPILPIKVCVYSTPPVKRWVLEDFLTTFKVSSLKKFRNKAVFVASCDTVEDHDNLCLMGPVRVGNSTVVFKPFHLTGTRDKSNRAQVKKQRNELRAVTKQCIAKNSDKGGKQQWAVHDNRVNQPSAGNDHCENQASAGNDNSGKQQWAGNDNRGNQLSPGNDSDCVLIDNIKEKLKQDISVVIMQEQLCREMKLLYDHINNPVIAESEYSTDVKSADSVSVCEMEQYNDTRSGVDFTDDVDIDNFTSNVKTESDTDLVSHGEDTNEESQLSAKDEYGGENVGDDIINSMDDESHITEDNDMNAADIDLKDVSEDDLEDW